MKKFKTKKYVNKKNMLYIIFFIILIIIFLYLSHFKLNNNYELFINHITNNFLNQKEKQKPLYYLMNNLDFFINDYLFVEDDVLLKKENLPLIYIYNTHNQETYKETDGVKANVLTTSKMLKDALNKYNIDSIVENEKVSDYLDGNYNDSYKISRRFLESIVLNNHTLNYFIDIHRDSVKEDYTQIVIGDKEYAKIMFVLGLENKNYQQNKQLMEKMNNYLNEFYPGLSRGIYEKSGSGVNGVYNQDFHKNTLLIEVGGVDSNLVSVANSTEILAKTLYYVIGEYDEKVS